jgi:hypothetical protein
MKSVLHQAHLYLEAHTRRLAADKVAASLKEVETAHKTLLMDMLYAAKINAVGDNKHIFAIVTKQEPQVENWEALYKHIKKTGEFELLFRRVNPTAVKERWEHNKVVPGVGSFPVDKLSVTKAKE